MFGAQQQQQLWHATCLALIAFCGFAHAKGELKALIFNFNNTLNLPFEWNCYELRVFYCMVIMQKALHTHSFTHSCN